MSALLRVAGVTLLLAFVAPVLAQQVDSLHIFTTIPAGRYTTSLAETTGWRLLKANSPYVSVGADRLEDLNADLNARKPVKHMHSELPGLSHIGCVYYDKRAHIFCLSQDEGLVVDLTARRQFRMEGTLQRAKLKAVLMALGL